MAGEPCSSSELKTRIVALEAGLVALKELLHERDLRYAQRAQSQDSAVDVAMESARTALVKADNALEKRLDSLNELRDMLSDQNKQFARATEVNLTIVALENRMTGLADLVHGQVARGGGMKDFFAYIVAAGGLAIALLALFFRVH